MSLSCHQTVQSFCILKKPHLHLLLQIVEFWMCQTAPPMLQGQYNNSSHMAFWGRTNKNVHILWIIKWFLSGFDYKKTNKSEAHSVVIWTWTYRFKKKIWPSETMSKNSTFRVWNAALHFCSATETPAADPWGEQQAKRLGSQHALNKPQWSVACLQDPRCGEHTVAKSHLTNTTLPVDQ